MACVCSCFSLEVCVRPILLSLRGLRDKRWLLVSRRSLPVQLPTPPPPLSAAPAPAAPLLSTDSDRPWAGDAGGGGRQTASMPSTTDPYTTGTATPPPPSGRSTAVVAGPPSGPAPSAVLLPRAGGGREHPSYDYACKNAFARAAQAARVQRTRHARRTHGTRSRPRGPGPRRLFPAGPGPGCASAADLT